MTDIFAKFLAENVASEKHVLEETTVNDDTFSGHLVITGSIYWGRGDLEDKPSLERPHCVPLSFRVKRVFSSSNSSFTFILSDKNEVYAFGMNDSGQLGLKDNVSRNKLEKVTISGSPGTIVKIATGRNHTLMLFSNGMVYGAGSNECGQLGLGSKVSSVSQFTRVSSLSDITDIACGWQHSLVCNKAGHVYSFGHPEYGQLGNGTTGEFIQTAGKVSHAYVYEPQLIQKFLFKDPRGAVTQYPLDSIHISKVAAGKNHSVCIETPVDIATSTVERSHRVFSWGFGGYGRLGHNSPADELFPREIAYFTALKSAPITQVPQRRVRSIACGASTTVAITEGGPLYYWGKIDTAREAVMYPKPKEGLSWYNVKCVAIGPNSVIVINSAHECGCWGKLSAGKFGFEDGSRQSASPRLIDTLCGYDIAEIVCGYGHVVAIVNDQVKKIEDFPILADDMLGSVVDLKRVAESNTGKNKKTKA